MATTQERFTAAVEAVRGQNIPVILNIMTCCRSCTTATDKGFPNEEAEKSWPHIWHYGGQDNELVWSEAGEPQRRVERDWDEDGEVTQVEDLPVDSIFFNHAGPNLTAARALVDAFRGHNFDVEWNGTEIQAVVVFL